MPRRINKKEIVAYIFLDDKCLDFLVLGSPSASMTAKANKKVKIPLIDQRKSIQIIFKKLGEDEKRFGSVTFRLSKFLGGLGCTYMHWVTLYDRLDEDVFTGQLGEDEFDMPRALLEYSIIGGKYTSTMDNLNKLRQAASGAGSEVGGGLDEQAMGASGFEEIKEEEEDEEDVDFNLMVEYNESRADKLQGRNRFVGVVVEDDGPSPVVAIDALKLK